MDNLKVLKYLNVKENKIITTQTNNDINCRRVFFRKKESNPRYKHRKMVRKKGLESINLWKNQMNFNSNQQQ